MDICGHVNCKWGRGCYGEKAMRVGGTFCEKGHHGFSSAVLGPSGQP